MADSRDLSWLNEPVVRMVIKEVSREVTQEVIAEHVKACPHGRRIANQVALLIGVAIGSGTAGGGIALVIAKAISGMP